MDKKSGAFEASLARLEAIVKQLESGDVDLDDSVALFKEGKDLARKCEALLKVAQDAVNGALSGESVQQPAATFFGDDPLA